MPDPFINQPPVGPLPPINFNDYQPYGPRLPQGAPPPHDMPILPQGGFAGGGSNPFIGPGNPYVNPPANPFVGPFMPAGNRFNNPYIGPSNPYIGPGDPFINGPSDPFIGGPAGPFSPMSAFQRLRNAYLAAMRRAF